MLFRSNKSKGKSGKKKDKTEGKINKNRGDDSWEEYSRQTRGHGTKEGYDKWLNRRMELDEKDKAREEQKRKNEESKQKTDKSTKKQDDKRDQVQEEKSDRDADKESTNRKNSTRRSRRKRDDNSYLAEIAKNTKNIYREVKGQVNGVGWNTS